MQPPNSSRVLDERPFPRHGERGQSSLLVDDRADGLTNLVTARNLDLGYNFDLNPKDANRTLSAHHWLVAELSHEAVD
jgi:hypothetical protein